MLTLPALRQSKNVQDLNFGGNLGTQLLKTG